MRRPLLILLTVLLQTAVLGYMIYDRAERLRSGKEVVLKVVPVDPRSLFRGDYVILTYDISNLKTADLAGDDRFETNDPIFVTLEKSNGTWAATSLSRTFGEASSDEVIIKGTVDYSYIDRPPVAPVGPGGDRLPQQPPAAGSAADNIADCDGECRVISVSYGIEAYFVEEGAGREIEDIRNDGLVSVLVAIDGNGRAAIKGLLLDGELRYEEPLL